MIYYWFKTEIGTQISPNNILYSDNFSSSTGMNHVNKVTVMSNYSDKQGSYILSQVANKQIII